MDVAIVLRRRGLCSVWIRIDRGKHRQFGGAHGDISATAREIAAKVHISQRKLADGDPVRSNREWDRLRKIIGPVPIKSSPEAAIQEFRLHTRECIAWNVACWIILKYRNSNTLVSGICSTEVCAHAIESVGCMQLDLHRVASRRRVKSNPGPFCIRETRHIVAAIVIGKLLKITIAHVEIKDGACLCDRHLALISTLIERPRYDIFPCGQCVCIPIQKIEHRVESRSCML